MDMLVNCSVFTLGVKVSFIEDGEIVSAVSSTMNAAPLRELAKGKEIGTIYVRGQERFTSKLCEDLMSDYSATQTKIVRID